MARRSANESEGYDDGESGFDWPVYADATFAGLSVLIPIPLVDMLFERVFRNRMPRAIARYRRHNLGPATVRGLNRGRWGVAGCLFLPVWLVLVFLKRLFRTVLYFLTVKDATDQLSHYWHRAYLIDHALCRGDLDDPERSPASIEAIRTLLDEITTSPVSKLAGQVIGSTRHVLRTVLRWLRLGVEDDVARAAHENMGRSWADLRAYFDEVGRRYDQEVVRLDDAAALRSRSVPPKPSAGS